jgi:hypothetical protein
MTYKMGFVLFPDEYNMPVYRISPFKTKDVSNNYAIAHRDWYDPSLIERHLNKAQTTFHYTLNGREGIFIALKSYGLQQSDLVTILTTSQNYYISSCVTNEIEKFCKWNREVTNETKIIFVNHEFGTVYPEMEKLVATGIPIIEDCCTTFFSQDEQNSVGKYGDFAVYSFPKFFPIQIGGLLVNNKNKPVLNSTLDEHTKLYIEKVLSYHLKDKSKPLSKRNSIYTYALEQYRTLGFTNYFVQNPLEVPSVMMLKNNGIIKDLPALKTNLWNHGIQSSVFYGADAFFIPSHQYLTKVDIIYFYHVLEHFINEQI